jgi:hypothetical protein
MAGLSSETDTIRFFMADLAIAFLTIHASVKPGANTHTK